MTKAHSSDDGFSLIEVLIAVTIMGVAVVAIIGAIMTSIVAADVHREQATGETVLRSYAEAARAEATANYDSCASTYSPVYTAPAGFTVRPVELWHYDGSGWTEGAKSSCSTPPADVVQKLRLTVVSAKGHSEEWTEIVVRKP